VVNIYLALKTRSALRPTLQLLDQLVLRGGVMSVRNRCEKIPVCEWQGDIFV